MAGAFFASRAGGARGVRRNGAVVRAKDRYDSLIRWYAQEFDLDPVMIQRQIDAESSFRPQVVSPAGAVGLMQAMPGTFAWAVKEMRSQGLIPLDYEVWIKNPEDSVHVGCWYDTWLYGRYAEIPDEAERWRFALAAYNCGRANLNKALHLAREQSGQPASFAAWERAGRLPGPWQEWQFTSRFLPIVTGARATETINYVRKIMGASS